MARLHVALSIVGIDRSDNGYFRAKVVQEKLIEASGIPYTIVRSTQFMEFLGGITNSSADGSMVRISPGLFQPIAADDVATNVADVALATPRNGIIEIARPERAPFNEIIARHLKGVGDVWEVVRDPEARYFGGRVEERSLVPLGEGSARLTVPAHAAPQPVVVPIMQKDLADTPGKGMLMITVEYPPGTVESIHRHDAYAFLYVVEGSIIERVRGGKEVTLTPGQTFYEGRSSGATQAQRSQQDPSWS